MSLSTPDLDQLARLGQVDPAYRHVPKVAEPGADLPLSGGHLKWYDIHRPDSVVSNEVREQARALLADHAEAGELGLANDLGWVELHLCGTSFYFLILCVWRNDNEMWQSVYYKDGDDPFTPNPRRTGFGPMQCVWELGVTMHEKDAWARYLRTDRGVPAKLAYLADSYEGEV